MGTTTLLSFEEFERLPDEPGKMEFLDGELIQLPPAKRRHMEISRRIQSAPALAFEVISESNTADQMDRKVKTYLTNGGVKVWLVYPGTGCVWGFREGHAEQFQNVLRSSLLPGLEMELSQRFD